MLILPWNVLFALINVQPAQIIQKIVLVARILILLEFLYQLVIVLLLAFMIYKIILNVKHALINVRLVKDLLQIAFLVLVLEF